MMIGYSKKKSKDKAEANQTLYLDSVKMYEHYQALAGAFSATTFPL